MHCGASPRPVHGRVATGGCLDKEGRQIPVVYGCSGKQLMCFALTKLQEVANRWYDCFLTVQLTLPERNEKRKEAFLISACVQQLLRQVEAWEKRRKEDIELYPYSRSYKPQSCGLPGTTCVEYIIADSTTKICLDSSVSLSSP